MTPARHNRLRWRCRRGMRELDLLLEPWFECHGAGLGEDELAAFERLLECSDTDLYAWFTARRHPDDHALAELVARIRAPAHA